MLPGMNDMKSIPRPTLSVIIPAYNVEQFIVPAVESVLSQGFQDLEVIVVNDGSNDATAIRLQKLDDPRLRVIHQPNGGLSAARNAGITNAKGRYIALLDGDDVWFPGCAQAHVQALDQDPTVGISYSYLAYIDERGERTGQLLITRLREPSLHQLVIRNVINSQVVVRAKCFEQAGLFNEQLRACEDHEMWVRILTRAGFKARLIPEVLAGYRVRGASLTMNFSHQLKYSHAVADIFVREVGISPLLKRRVLAESYRIASRKALSSGQRHYAVQFIRQSLTYYPWLPLCDLRALGTTLLVAAESVLPNWARRLPYRMLRVVMALFYRRKATCGELTNS